jgi:hypothetical protein
MIKIQPGQVVNIYKDKVSYLAIDSDADEFTDKTDVKKVVEKNSSGMVVQEWTPKVSKRHDKDEIRVRLKAKERVKKDTDPDAGTLTITLDIKGDGTNVVDMPAKVVYVNDNEA